MLLLCLLILSVVLFYKITKNSKNQNDEEKTVECCVAQIIVGLIIVSIVAMLVCFFGSYNKAFLEISEEQKKIVNTYESTDKTNSDWVWLTTALNSKNAEVEQLNEKYKLYELVDLQVIVSSHSQDKHQKYFVDIDQEQKTVTFSDKTLRTE